MLQQIKRNSLAGKQNICKPGRARDYFSGFDFFPVAGECLELLLWIERHEDFLGSFEPGDHHFLASYETSTSARVAHQYGLRRDVASSQVFAQKKANAGIERAFVKPVYRNASRT